MAPIWRLLQETPENLLRNLTKTLKGLHSPDLTLMELHGTHLKHADPWSVVGPRGFSHEDQDPGRSQEHCTTAMTDVITPSVGSYSSVILAEDNEMHEITEEQS